MHNCSVVTYNGGCSTTLKRKSLGSIKLRQLLPGMNEVGYDKPFPNPRLLQAKSGFDIVYIEKRDAAFGNELR